MGMSIDEAIKHLDTYSSTMGSGQTTQAQHEESKRVAVDIMRKYQKIQEIVNSKTTRLSYEEGFRQIKKVVEDGRN